MNKKGGLGKGIGALFSDNSINMDNNLDNTKKEAKTENIVNKIEEVSNDIVKEIKLVDIVPNQKQARKVFDKDKLKELSDSIKMFGVIQPIILTKTGDYYTIIAGERRWRASKLAGLKTIPAIIKENDIERNDQISLIENVQRENLNPVERAKGIRELMDKYHLTGAALSEITGMNMTMIFNAIKISKIEPDLLDIMQNAGMSEIGCITVSDLSDYNERKEFILYIIEDGLSISQARKRLSVLDRKKEPIKKLPIFKNIESEFSQYFGNKVELKVSGGKSQKGKIIINYDTDEDLERILGLIR